ncbi:MAG TPA: hypothetical protein VJX67_15675, partial [Blastocatellia bacterium]|nr:hypothetical protein [Blastocatellia bacterium]
ATLSYTIDNQKNTYSSDFTILVLVKDESGAVVKKLSQHYQLTGASSALDGAKKAQIIFYREATLPPGSYSVEAIAYDAATARAGITKASVQVPVPDPAKLRLSSVVVIRRVEKLPPADQKPDNPLQYGAMLVYPNLGEPLSKAAKRPLAFFVTIYPPKGAASPPKLTIEVDTKDGKSLAAVSPALPAADASGRIQFGTGFPIDGFPPGDYALKITVGEGTDSASRSTAFSVQP